MMWPVDPESEESPSESRELRVVVMITPTAVAMATPARNGTETLSALGAVTKIIAAMICGPAIIVMARGRICRFMALTLAFLLGLGGGRRGGCGRGGGGGGRGRARGGRVVGVGGRGGRGGGRGRARRVRGGR